MRLCQSRWRIPALWIIKTVLIWLWSKKISDIPKRNAFIFDTLIFYFYAAVLLTTRHCFFKIFDLLMVRRFCKKYSCRLGQKRPVWKPRRIDFEKLRHFYLFIVVTVSTRGKKDMSQRCKLIVFLQVSGGEWNVIKEVNFRHTSRCWQ